jgi:glutamate 5-kinase
LALRYRSIKAFEITEVPDMPRPKNVIWIMHDYLGCTGHPTLKTPNMDALAARGLRFSNAYVQSPICGPSRMSFYTKSPKASACTGTRPAAEQYPSRISLGHSIARPHPMARPNLKKFRRIVVKVGSSLLIDSDAGEVRAAWLAALAADLAKLHGEGRELLIVSSGSIALGRSRLKLPRGALKLEESQAAAAVGQIALARIWSEVLGHHGIGAGQILVTLQDTEERRRYLNARSTIAKLLEWRAVPVINENDTVATNEIRYGDNDRLAARVATMTSADLLILLSDIDGLYDAPPADNPNAKLIPLVESVTSEIEAMAGAAESELARGGMRTKIEAAKIATTAGTHMLIASGKIEHPLQAISDGGRCTWFLTPANPVTARKRWIAGSLEPKGTLTIDAGAVSALRAGKSLLPAGVIRVDGQFARGDAVVVRGPDTHEIGRGLVAYDADDAEKIKGRSSPDVMAILGISGRAEMIHRDDLVVGAARGISVS